MISQRLSFDNFIPMFAQRAGGKCDFVSRRGLNIDDWGGRTNGRDEESRPDSATSAHCCASLHFQTWRFPRTRSSTFGSSALCSISFQL
jgi:hypothetical protein